MLPVEPLLKEQEYKIAVVGEQSILNSNRKAERDTHTKLD